MLGSAGLGGCIFTIATMLVRAGRHLLGIAIFILCVAIYMFRCPFIKESPPSTSCSIKASGNGFSW
jgi:hypothetical protein